jgi:hypothetical protein
MLPLPFWEILGKPIDSLVFLTRVSKHISDVIDYDNENKSVDGNMFIKELILPL